MERRGRGALRYSLSAMLLLTTLVAVWLSFQVKWMQERAEAIAWIEDQADFWDDLPVEQGAKLDDRAPFPLRGWALQELGRLVCVSPINSTSRRNNVNWIDSSRRLTLLWSLPDPVTRKNTLHW